MRWVWWFVIVVVAVTVIIGGTMLWKSKNEQIRVEKIRQEAIKAGVEERKE